MSSNSNVLSLEELDAIICEDTPSVEIVFDCEESDDSDAGLVTVEVVDTAIVLAYVERSLSDRASEATTLRLPRIAPATNYRAWLALGALAVLVVLVGFVFGRGLLDVASLLSLGTMLPVGTIADWGKGSVDSAGFAHPLEYRPSRPSAVRPVRPLLELCTCWGCMGNEDCWVYQN